MGKLIKDEFTDLPVSPQRKSQLRNQRDGRCIICGDPELVTKFYCDYHARCDHLRGAKRRGVAIRKYTTKWGKRGERFDNG